MPKFTFTGLTVTSDTTSNEFTPGCGQDMRWLLHVTTSGRDGTPNLIIEESASAGWTPVQNPKTLLFFFPLDDNLVGIKDSYFMGEKMRLRIELNGNTTGTIAAIIDYKTKV